MGSLKPNFFLIGAAKSGTTAIWDALRHHSDVFLPDQKEPHYLAWLANPAMVGPAYSDALEGRRSYDELYRHASRTAVGDASTSSLYVPGTAEVIAREVPDARILVILRHPVDRAWSHFWHFVAAGAETTDDFEFALAAEESRLASGELPFTYGYANWSLYAPQLRPYCELFDRSQLTVLLYEDLVARPKDVIVQICAALSIDPSGCGSIRTGMNQFAVPRYRRTHALATGTGRAGRAVHRRLPNGIRHGMVNRLGPRLTYRPQLADHMRRKVTALFLDDILATEVLIGRDLSHWRAAEPAAGGHAG